MISRIVTGCTRQRPAALCQPSNSNVNAKVGMSNCEVIKSETGLPQGALGYFCKGPNLIHQMLECLGGKPHRTKAVLKSSRGGGTGQ